MLGNVSRAKKAPKRSSPRLCPPTRHRNGVFVIGRPVGQFYVTLLVLVTCGCSIDSRRSQGARGAEQRDEVNCRNMGAMTGDGRSVEALLDSVDSVIERCQLIGPGEREVYSCGRMPQGFAMFPEGLRLERVIVRRSTSSREVEEVFLLIPRGMEYPKIRSVLPFLLGSLGSERMSQRSCWPEGAGIVCSALGDGPGQFVATEFKWSFPEGIVELKQLKELDQVRVVRP